jgi:hypothetical protein
MLITSENFTESHGKISSYLISGFALPIDIIEYRSGQEGLSNATITFAAKHLFANPIAALVSLWQKHLYYWEEWKDISLSTEDADGIIEYWLPYSISQWQFEKLEKSNFYSSFHMITDEINCAICQNSSSDNISYFSQGIYMNNVRINNDREFQPPMMADTYENGVILCDEWNDKQYFVETNSRFIYFEWGTSA